MDQLSQEPDVDFLIIADRAEAINGKLYMMGGAWDQITVADPAQPINFSVAMGINIPWNATNEHHRMRLVVEDADGTMLVELEGEFVAGRPPHLGAGSTQRVLFATPLGFRLPRAGSCAIVVHLNGKERARTAFHATFQAPRA